MFKIDKATRIDRKRPNGYGREMRAYESRPKVSVFPSGESILDNLNNRRSRPYTEYRKLLKEPVAKLLGIPADDFKMSWSQTANCQCGCSPGFIINSSKRTLPRADFYFDVSCEEVAPQGDTTPEGMSEQEASLLKKMGCI